MDSNGTPTLLFPFPKSPGVNQEKSAYGDETVRYFQFQMYITEKTRGNNSYSYSMLLWIISLLIQGHKGVFFCLLFLNAMQNNKNGSCLVFAVFVTLLYEMLGK